MSLLNSIKKALPGSGVSIQETMLKTAFQKFAKEGVKQLIIDIGENGEYNIDTVFTGDEKKTVVSTETYRFLTDFFNQYRDR
jgi:hypothetical protein